MTIARIRNWDEFQHYKRRSPPWVKLHRRLLDDRNFIGLPVEARGLLPLLWLLASEAKTMDGTLNIDTDELVFRLRLPARELDTGVRVLLDRGWLELVSGDLFSLASKPLAARGHGATPETETEAEQRQMGPKGPVRSADRFEAFWKLYPVKVAKQKALAAWKRKRLDAHADKIIADVTRRITPATLDRKWAEGIIPHPTTYLNQERWLDEPATKLGAESRSTAGSSPAVEETPERRYEGLVSFLQSQVEHNLIDKAEARRICEEFKRKHGLPPTRQASEGR